MNLHSPWLRMSAISIASITLLLCVGAFFSAVVGLISAALTTTLGVAVARREISLAHPPTRRQDAKAASSTYAPTAGDTLALSLIFVGLAAAGIFVYLATARFWTLLLAVPVVVVAMKKYIDLRFARLR
jgi:hypothetical protein